MEQYDRLYELYEQVMHQEFYLKRPRSVLE